MFYYLWPMGLVVLSNVVYQICAKSIPDKTNPFAALTVTYLVGALASVVMYFTVSKQGNLIKEFAHMNWVPFVFGIVLCALEVGWIYAYKAGWQISTAFMIQSSLLAVILIFVGSFGYREVLTWNKIIGILICLVGLIFINLA